MKRYPLFFLTILILVLGITTSALAFTFTIITPPGAVATVAEEINNQGQIVGIFRDSSDVIHGFLRKADGTFTTIITPPGQIPGGIRVFSINDPGRIAGNFLDSSGGHGLLRNKDGTFTIIDPP